MTKEELIKTAWVCNNNHAVVRLADFQTFLESNVCIPKGENRHPDADLLHALAEDTRLRYEVRDSTDCNFTDDDNFNQNMFEYRVKPPEPTYEYMIYDKDGNTTFATEEQFSHQTAYPYIAMSTKRERK